MPKLALPLFVKPVKGTFSLFAAKVDDEPALRRHLDFKPHERLLLRDRGQGSKVEFTHGVFSSKPAKDAHMRGWMACFKMLEKTLESA